MVQTLHQCYQGSARSARARAAVSRIQARHAPVGREVCDSPGMRFGDRDHLIRGCCDDLRVIEEHARIDAVADRAATCRLIYLAKSGRGATGIV